MEIRIFDVEKIITRDKKNDKPNGVFIPIWRVWDSKYISSPQMVYVATIPVGEMKGPHLHKSRTGYITPISGKLLFILKSNGNYKEIEIDSEIPKTIEVLPGVGLVTINIGTNIATILNLCYPAWHPENQDNFTADFSDYDFSKWQNLLNKL